jgi:hypothetical protein
MSLFLWDVALHHWGIVQQQFFLDTSTPADETAMLSQNIGQKSFSNEASHPRRKETSIKK